MASAVCCADRVAPTSNPCDPCLQCEVIHACKGLRCKVIHTCKSPPMSSRIAGKSRRAEPGASKKPGPIVSQPSGSASGLRGRDTGVASVHRDTESTRSSEACARDGAGTQASLIHGIHLPRSTNKRYVHACDAPSEQQHAGRHGGGHDLHDVHKVPRRALAAVIHRRELVVALQTEHAYTRPSHVSTRVSCAIHTARAGALKLPMQSSQPNKPKQ